MKIRLTPPRMMILSFLLAIIAGTAVLCLPVSVRSGERMPLIDALFTATSAICVTGLVVKDIGGYFSTFGRWVIFALFQIGGLGIMTFTTLFAVMFGRRISLRDDDVVRSSFSTYNVLGLKKLILYILGITFAFEAAGALALFLRWRAVTDWPLRELIGNSVFHSVSAFCNCGLGLFRNSLEDFVGDPYVNITMMLLIVAGGLGFVVLMELIGLFGRWRGKGGGGLSLQARIVLIMTAVLIVTGAAVLFLMEKDNTLKGASARECVLGSFFQSVVARTAGFNTLPIGNFTVPSLLTLIFLMFVGASPGSTGGGIKTVTFVIIVATVWHMLHSKNRVMMFRRSIPQKVIRQAFVIFFLSLSWIFLITLAISSQELSSGGAGKSCLQIFFEVASAFGTVGLSTGITAHLTAVEKILIIFTMFIGRVGFLTMILAALLGETRQDYIYPEENVMVG